MRKIYVLVALCISVVLLESGIESSFIPPQGRTGATSSTCRSCHSTYALNANGSVSISALPTDGYVPGTAYPFSLTILHDVADRTRWGFSIIAVNSAGASIGTFSSGNSNAAKNGSELSHLNAPVTAASASYTFNNLTWTAPAAASGPVTFYYTGVAANNSSGSGLDYVYAGSNVFVLPLKLLNFTGANENNAVSLKWQTANEVNTGYFDVERSDDGQFYFSIGRVNANQNTTTTTTYSYKDSKAASTGGNIFYRLKMVDKDGKSKYSEVISIKPHNVSLALKKVYPTVFSAGSNINIEMTSDKNRFVNLSMIDENGKVYLKQNTALSQGSNDLKITTPSNLPKGMMFLKLNTNNFQQTESLIIQ